MTAGNVQPATSLNTPEFNFYSGTGETFVYSQPELDNNTFAGKDSLVMLWDGDTGKDLAVAAWEYVYDVDPDLTGMLIEVSVFPNAGIWDFSVGLTDINGNSAEWFVAAPPTGVWSVHVLDPSNPGAGWIVGTQDPLFDITQVVSIRLDEAGMTSVVFPPLPPGTSTGIPGTPQWNAWDHLSVYPIPEPGSAVLLLLGIAMMSIRSRPIAREA